MSEPKVSIIVPVYNVEACLSECVESLLAQTYGNLEIILIDDGSTDNSGSLCNELARKDKRIKVVHQANKGLSGARNTGLETSTGIYLAFVDSDDTVKPDFIRSLLKAAETSMSAIVVCGYNDETPSSAVLSGEEATVRLLTRQENLDILTWNKLYRKSLFSRKIRFPEGKIHEDNLTTYKLYAKAERICFIDKSLYCYRAREDSITKKENKLEHLSIRKEAAKEAIDYFCDNSNLKAAAEISLLLAELAYLDNALNRTIDQKYLQKSLTWLNLHAKSFSGNPFLTKKLKLYLVLANHFGGLGYKTFRLLKHD